MEVAQSGRCLCPGPHAAQAADVAHAGAEDLQHRSCATSVYTNTTCGLTDVGTRTDWHRPPKVAKWSSALRQMRRTVARPETCVRLRSLATRIGGYAAHTSVWRSGVRPLPELHPRPAATNLTGTGQAEAAVSSRPAIACAARTRCGQCRGSAAPCRSARGRRASLKE